MEREGESNRIWNKKDKTDRERDAVVATSIKLQGKVLGAARAMACGAVVGSGYECLESSG